METLENDAKAFNNYASAAVELSNAHVSRDGLFTVTRSVRDIDNNRRRNFLYSIPLPSTTTEAAPVVSIPPVELHDSIKIRLPSPSGEKVAIFREESPKEEGKKSSRQVLEVWVQKGQALQRRILLKDALHGKIISDAATFGGPCWNHDETALVYPAERKPPETGSFFEENEQKTEDVTGGGRRAKQPGAQNELGLGKTESWGEKYGKQSALLDLFCVNVETGKVGRVTNVPESDLGTTLGGYTLGQPVFSPGEPQSIVYTGWDAGGGGNMPRRLGLLHCIQRPSKLYSSSVANLLRHLSQDEAEKKDDDDYVVLTPDERLSRSPRFSPVVEDGSFGLYFLSSKLGFHTHFGCLGLHSIRWRDGKADLSPSSHRVIIDEVTVPKKSPSMVGEVAGLPFPGLFLLNLPQAAFLSGDCLVTSTQWGSCEKLVRVQLKEQNNLCMLSCGKSAYTSEAMLCATPDRGVILSTQAPNEPATVWHVASLLGPMDSSPSREGLKMQQLAKMPQICSTSFSPVNSPPSSKFSFDVKVIEPSIVDGVDRDIPIQSILLLPDKVRHPKPPLIVMPHGGPHASASTGYFPDAAFLCAHGGYALLRVNYRGSAGFGQSAINSLPTRIGDMDVNDVLAATRDVLDSGLVDPERVGISGGSHGGFLLAHLTGQHPELFKAAVSRNPVVNIPSMVTPTDIPDWCYVESFGSYNWEEYRPPTKDELQGMWEKSPIRYVSNVKTPTLMGIGMSDLRVPPSQGLEWYHSLRSRGVPTKLLLYEDQDHAIAGVASEADQAVNTKRWFDKYLR